MIAATSPNVRSTVYGAAEVDLDDPAELYHEASKLYPALRERQAASIVRLAQDDDLLAAALHPVRRNRQLPSIELAPPSPPDASLWSAIAGRRSEHAFTGTLGVDTLATLLLAGYGPRSVPSGGALYPLEVYVATCRVTGLPQGILHLDPERPALEIMRRGDVTDELGAAMPAPEFLADASTVIFVTAVFWRTRFKYGLRGYRFALLEAGHVMQNVLLAATVLGVTAFPLGGFYDAAVEELLGVDGVDESVLYGAVLG
ncbi:MAG TPA: SagB/ThcOx family dehydrogenase [Gaiellaceae bacterium]|nr:SagB/ThcOx family dehydrogenase [Gaiellaceae bacterium]